MSIEVDMNIRPQQQISDEHFVVMLKGSSLRWTNCMPACLEMEHSGGF